METLRQHTIVHLVHGTWPKGAMRHLPQWLQRPMAPEPTCWFEEGSDFLSALGREITNTTFSVFEWSGSNSIFARKRASRSFREYLETALERDPSAHHLVIAHSHGGNVALEGSRGLHVGGLATLATPFLQFKPLRLSQATGWLLDNTLVGVLQLPLVLGFGGLFLYRRQLPYGVPLSELAEAVFWALMLAWVFIGPFFPSPCKIIKTF